MIDIKVKYLSSMTAFERVFSYPLRQIATHLLARISERGKRGIGAAGPMRPYGADSDPAASTRWWVRPEKAGAAPAENRITSGPFTGWAVFDNYHAAARAMKAGEPRDLEERGDFWRSVMIRVMSPARVKVAPYGAHRAEPGQQRISNTSVGYLASRGEPKPLLHPTVQEITEAARIVFAEIDGQAIEAARIAGLGTQVRRKAASLQRRASKLLG